MAKSTEKVAPVVTKAGPSQADYFKAIDKPEDRSPEWYLNLLAGSIEGPVPGSAPYTAQHAACLWAGVGVGELGLDAALNLKAGNLDRDRQSPLLAVLNQLAQNRTLDDFNANRGALMSDKRALYQICMREVGGSDG